MSSILNAAHVKLFGMVPPAPLSQQMVGQVQGRASQWWKRREAGSLLVEPVAHAAKGGCFCCTTFQQPVFAHIRFFPLPFLLLFLFI